MSNDKMSLSEEMTFIADRLASGEFEEYTVMKSEVIAFGEVIRNRPDFLHFHGTAQKGGNVIYKYQEEARS